MQTVVVPYWFLSKSLLKMGCWWKTNFLILCEFEFLQSLVKAPISLPLTRCVFKLMTEIWNMLNLTPLLIWKNLLLPRLVINGCYIGHVLSARKKDPSGPLCLMCKLMHTSCFSPLNVLSYQPGTICICLDDLLHLENCWLLLHSENARIKLFKWYYLGLSTARVLLYGSM